jgi:LacI family fructose operon transcriptional repressor
MAKDTRKPTIYDIALAGGASPATVSLVLNGRWQKHRVKADTAERILGVAEELGYSTNLKARGLRLSKSGLAGMILPHYRNRFFAGLAEAFETEARRRGLCPIVVSTQRDPAIERRVTDVLLAQQVEFLFITGVHNPAPLNALCATAGVVCINVDLPGEGAPSVTSDNEGGAYELTLHLVERLKKRGKPIGDWMFFGGVAEDNSTGARMAGFRRALARHGVSVPDSVFDCHGYAPDIAEKMLREHYESRGSLPAGLFINGVPTLEGALDFTSTLPAAELAEVVIGAFDWDPFAAHLPFDLTMVRQDIDRMVEVSFQFLDEYRPGHNPSAIIPTVLESVRSHPS